MDRWQPVGAEERLGIAIQNYSEDAPFRLRLSFGETVVIKEKNGEWYLGHPTSKINQIGIFPKSFINLKCEGKDGTEDKGKPDFIEEVTSSIREWGKIWKKLYMERKSIFLRIKMMIEDLIFFRSKMLSGLISKHHLLEIKGAVISLIEDGNKLLGMDMVVRDENGDILDPIRTPIMKMYKQHVHCSEKIRQSINGLPRSGAMEISSYFHAFYVSIVKCDLFMEEDLELILFLYDSLEELPMTENFVSLWKKDEQVLGTEKSKLSVLFKDLAPEDLRKEQVYLVCNIIKIGKKENKECEYNDSVNMNDDTKKNGHHNKGKKCKRRPFGVAAVDVSPYLNDTGERNEISIFLPFLRFDHGDLASTLKKLILLRYNEKKQHVNQGLRVIAKVLPGEINEAFRRNQHLKLEKAVSARKMGIPKVVFPNYVRNEIYLTLVEGEFHKTPFTPDRNIEVAVSLCDQNGAKISDMIFIGAGVKSMREYRSVIYFHEMKPKWMETIKINIPHTVFRGLHLKFTFTHRALSNMTEKPFALAYIKILQNNGALLFDGRYSLVVYKVDQNKWKDEDHMYLYLPSKTSEVPGSEIKGFSVNKKDKFVIRTLACSTKLTQNVHLVWLLDWMNNTDILSQSLTALLNVNGREIVKFLPDILDVLFKIIMEDLYYEAHGNLIFSCLVYIFDMVSDENYTHVQNFLESYIKESFCSPTVFGKLILLLEKHFNNIHYSKKECLLKLVRSLKFFMMCIVRSKQLYDELWDKNLEIEFEAPLKKLLNTISKSLCYCEELDLNDKREIFIHLYPVYSEILGDFQCLFHCAVKDLSVRIAELIIEHDDNYERSSVLIASDITHSKMLFLSDCRNILMPVIFDYIIQDLQNLVEVELCVDCLIDLLDLCFELSIESSIECITMITIIRTLIYSIIHVGNLKIVGKMVTLMIALLGQKQFDFLKQCTNNFSDDEMLLVYLMEMLIFFGELVSRPVYPSDWCDMVLLQNSVILKTLKSISTIISRKFLNPFEFQIWSNYFHSSVAFVTQPCLQLETFSEKKRMHILMNFKDMRKEMILEIKNMWFTLGIQKMKFIPDLVGLFLEISAIPDVDLQKTIVPLFFDMAQCEFYCCGLQRTELHGSNVQNVLNFFKFEKEFIGSMNKLLEGGKGEISHMNHFYDTLGKSFEEDSSMKDEGSRFVTSIKYQLKWLHLYRKHSQEDNKGHAITCAYELLNFYQHINNIELYTRYVCKLFNLHLECENYTEAAHSLDLLSNLLNWSDEPAPLYLVENIYHDCRSNYTFKEALYEDIITYLDKGRMWSAALSYCKELSKIYEYKVQDYLKLSNILKKMAQFYDHIMNETFPEAEYFCISYYGRGFPCFLQNKTFIHRWRTTEKWRDFYSHIQRLFPRANLANEAPGSEIKQSSSQNIYIHQVYPVFNDGKYMNLPIHGQILRHLLDSDVNKFYCPAPLMTQGQSGCENSSLRLCNSRTIYGTSVSFPGILMQAPVVLTESHEISLIKNLIDEIKRNNMSFHSVLPLGSNTCVNVNHICYKLKKTVEGSVIYNASAELISFLGDFSKHEDLGKLIRLLKEQKSLLQYFLNILREDFPEPLKIYMKVMLCIINEFSSGSDHETSTETELHFPVFIKEKSVKDAQNNELSRKSGYKILDGFKRKASLTRKIILSGRRSSESQAGNSQWYIHPSSASNFPSTSTLPMMNFSDKMGRDSVFYDQASLATSYKSLSSQSLQNLRDASMDIHENFIIKSKVDETISIPDPLQSNEKFAFSYSLKTSDEDDCLSFITAVSHLNVLCSSNSTDESQNLAIASTSGNKIVNTTPPPLPPKQGETVKNSGYLQSSKFNDEMKLSLNKDEKSMKVQKELESGRYMPGKLTNEEDKSPNKSTNLSTEVQSVLSHESGQLCLDKTENEMENDIPPPVPPRKKRLNRK